MSTAREQPAAEARGPAYLSSVVAQALAAGHRLGERNRRWILFGMAVYGAVRIGSVLASSPSAEITFTRSTIVVGIIVSLPLTTGIALLGARWARRTQAAFYAGLYFRRLGPADQEAALALLDESVSATPAATPPAAAPRTAAGSSAPPPAPRGRH